MMTVNYIQTVVLLIFLVSCQGSLEVNDTWESVIDQLSPDCRSHFEHQVKQAKLGAEWALSMIDAGTKAPNGLIWGHWTHLGNFDECIGAEELNGMFRGKYCLAGMALNDTLITRTPLEPLAKSAFFLRWSLCVPNSCSAEDIVQIAQSTASMLPPPLGPLNVIASVEETACHVLGEGQDLSAGFWVYIAIQIILVTLAGLAVANKYWIKKKISQLPLPDTLQHQQHGGLWLYLEAFDITENLTRLLNTCHNKNSIPVIDGVRALTNFWILTGHRFNEDINGVPSNYNQATNIYQQPLAMIIINSYVAVDTFFILSGALVYLNSAKDIQNNTFNVIKYYIYRYFRITTPYAMVILYYVYVLPIISSGPRWYSENTKSADNCVKNWWTALLYIQNYNKFEVGTCITQTWYLPVDMQLAWLAPLLILPLHSNPRAGRQLTAIVLLVSCFIPFGIAYANEMFWAYHGTNFFLNFDYTELMYFPTHTRASPYIAGLILGHLLYCTKNKEVALLSRRSVVMTCWIVAMICCATVVFSLSLAYQPWHGYNQLNSAFYNGFSHLGWAVGVSWLIYACSMGKGGFVNKILSWGGWLPLSRLSYCAYLVQYVWLLPVAGTNRVNYHFSMLNSLQDSLADLIPVYLIAAILHLTVEAPAMRILRRVFHPKKA